MSTHQKRFLMMHINLVKQKSEKIDDSSSRCGDRQSGTLTFSPPQRDYEVGRIKLFINKLYFITIIAKELNTIYLSK